MYQTVHIKQFPGSRVLTGHEKPEKPEKQVTFVKSHGKYNENFKKLTKVMKVVVKQRYTVSGVF